MAQRIIPIELMEKAKENKIPAITVYKRVKSGKYTHEEAVTMPVMTTRNHFKADGSTYYKRSKSKGITFFYYDDDLDRLSNQIKLANNSQSRFICDAVEFYLNHLEQK
jgi:phosphoribosylformylglycinamidine (FGAM) synthase-like amidotransferase family enzyme